MAVHTGVRRHARTDRGRIARESSHQRRRERAGSPPATERVVRLPMLSVAQRIQYAILICLFIASAYYFWAWWLQPAHRGNAILYALMTGSVCYLTLVLPGMYTFFLGWMRKPQHMPAQQGHHVAMISLTVPGSESLTIVRRQLEAMTAVTYPHESWILVDKVHSDEIQALAKSLNVRYFSRHDRETWGDLVEYWNQPEAPFKAKTKAGNVNAWLDAIDRLGERYDLFTQLDIDHIPEPRYLDMVIGYFRDPRIAWVQAPSVYSNFEPWPSRGSAEQELVLQGPLQAGFFGFSSTPFIIGSHCTYRMGPIREIGGFQPTRAEDHLDTVVLTAKGYRGVFMPEVIAVGDGPETFETYIGQQFAWAHSMIDVLFRFTPRLIWHYTPRQAVQFLFVQTWYTLWSITMCLMFCLPSIALLSNTSISHTTFWDFTVHSFPQAAVAFIIWFWSKQWFRPRGLSLSWRGIVLHVARWPIVLSALIQVLLRVEKPYMITRKGVDQGRGRPFSLAPYIPYFVLMLGSVVTSWYYLASIRHSGAQGYLLFSLEGAVMLLGVYLVVLVCDIRTLTAEGLGFMRGLLLRGKALLILFTFATLLGSTGVASFPQIVEAISFRDPGDARTIEAPRTAVSQAIAVGDQHTDRSSDDPTVAATPVSATDIAEAPSSAVAVSPDDATDDAPRVAVAPTTRPQPLGERNPPMAVSLPPLPVVGLPTDHLLFGAYDPQTRQFSTRPMDIDHGFLSWEKPDEIAAFIATARAEQRVPLVTIEPWTTASNIEHNILADTALGTNDALIRADARAIKSHAPQVVIVRFAHEMELTDNYPWAIANPDLFIQAYRHYVDVFRDEGVTNILWMWSPAGNGDAPRFYPGDSYVDLVGLTILSNREWDLSVGATDALSFDELFDVKYRTVARFEKPIIIAEFGVANDTDARQAAWLRDADASFSAYPLLKGVVYFNAKNAPNTWTGTVPDFRLPATLIWPASSILPAEPRRGTPQ